jgi:hypothetical protein
LAFYSPSVWIALDISTNVMAINHRECLFELQVLVGWVWTK